MAFEISGFDRLNRRIDRLEGDFKAEIMNQMEQAVDELAEEVKSNMPEDTGRAKASIFTEVSESEEGIVGEVISSHETLFDEDFYVAYLEFGTEDIEPMEMFEDTLGDAKDLLGGKMVKAMRRALR